jgi:hypothetical protein
MVAATRQHETLIYGGNNTMSGERSNHWRQQAIILGRVERLLGRDCNVNPYPVRSEQWMAFQEGWFREFDKPVIDEICKQNPKRKRLDRANRVSSRCDSDCQN